jgi:rubrerythrin
MSIKFSADEILDVAERIERNGARFYRRAAELQEDQSKGQLLSELAAMEDQHELTFQNLRASLTAREREETAYDPEDELGFYLQAMADGHIFDPNTDPAAALSKNEPLESILRTAIGLEKESVVFYQGVKSIVPERLGRDRVEAIIREEVGHVGQLSTRLAALKGR